MEWRENKSNHWVLVDSQGGRHGEVFKENLMTYHWFANGQKGRAFTLAGAKHAVRRAN